MADVGDKITLSDFKTLRDVEARRNFMKDLVRYGIAFPSLAIALKALGFLSKEAFAAMGNPKEVTFYRKLKDGLVQCEICPLNCILKPGETCFCRTRNNVGGVLYTYAYNNPCILKVDPIEKLPLNHFMPGTQTISIATGGCNLRCLYCQNWEQSQARPEELKTFYLDSQKTAKISITQQINTIAYTYTEPVVFSEYAIDIADYTHSYGIRHVAATALYMNPEPLRDFCKRISAFSITLKGFRDEFYRNVCGQPLEPILKAIEVVKDEGVWFELINLLVPTYNDSEEEVKDLCRWVRRTLGKDVPLHFARFVPEYRLRNLPQTPVQTMERAREIAIAEGIDYVYLSNVAPHEGNNTFCHSCNKAIIERLGFKVLNNRMKDGKCPYCKKKIPGVWT